MLEKSENDTGREAKAEARRCESSCLVAFLVDETTVALMMGDIFGVRGQGD